MKNLIYLLIIVLLSAMFSCEEDESTTTDTSNDGLITLEEIGVRWYFNYYEFDGLEIDCETILDENSDMKYGFFDWYFDIVEMEATSYPSCSYHHNEWELFPLTKESNTIKMSGFTYTVVGYDAEEYILRLRLDKSPSGFGIDDYLGGIMVFGQ